MKRIMVMVVIFVMMFGAFNMSAHAGIRDEATRAKFEQEFNTECKEAYEQFKEAKADGEIHLVKDMEVSYNEIGINVYDICIHVVLEEKEQTFEFHTFYDAVEDEWFTEYFQFGEERMSYEEFEELYPELLEEID